MSKDMLGQILRALVGVDIKYHGVVLNVVQRLVNGEVAPFWNSRFAKASRCKPPQAATSHKFLRPVVVDTAVFDPSCYHTDKNVWCSPEFKENILPVGRVFQPTDDLPKPSGFDLIQTSTDEEIQSEFPKEHVFGADEFLWRAKQMTEAQTNGAPGHLLADGSANIFFVVGKGGAVFTVDVYWFGGHRQWRFHCSSLGVSRWDGGYRAFSRN